MKENFNAEKETQNLLNWIREYFKEHSSVKGAVIGISGGKDSTVVSKLLVEALGKERVFGVLMPNGEQKDINDSLKVVELLGINYKVVNIEKAYNGILEAINIENIAVAAKTNIGPRLRMTTLYAIAADMGYMVCGTGNKSEKFVGYTTKWGDGASDFNPIGNLTTEEVKAIGDYLGLPKYLVHKTPSDGLCGKSDEENLGFTYNDVNTYIEKGTTGNNELDEKIKLKNKYNKHKNDPIPMYKPL